MLSVPSAGNAANALAADVPAAEGVRTLVATTHGRAPVYRGDFDQVVGVALIVLISVIQPGGIMALAQRGLIPDLFADRDLVAICSADRLKVRTSTCSGASQSGKLPA